MGPLLRMATAVVMLATTATGIAAGLDGTAGVNCFGVAVDGARVHVVIGLGSGAKDDAQKLSYAQSEDGGATWTAPVEIPIGGREPGYLHRGNDPQIVACGRRVVVMWTAKGEGPFGSGPLAGAVSEDGGATWRAIEGPRVKGAEGASGYRFPAVEADGQGFGVVWIHAAGEERSLRFARRAWSGARWSEPVTVEGKICACCWNALRRDGAGRLMVLYRDDEPRDMKVAVSDDGGATWRIGGYAGAFGWKLNGCPHVGGGLAWGGADGGWWASVWTGVPGAEGCYAMHSGDGGRNWSVKRMSAGRHTDIAALPGGGAVMVWDETNEAGESGVWMSEAGKAGAWSAAKRVSQMNHSATTPRVVVSRGRVIGFWSEQGEGGGGMMLRVKKLAVLTGF